MGEKASIFQGTQLGIETVAGTAVPANKKLLSLNITPAPHAETKPFRPDGSKLPTMVPLNKEYTTLNIDSIGTYNEIVYLLASLLNYTAPAQQGSTTAYKYAFVPNNFTEDVGKTFTVEQGDANSAWRYAGAKVSGLSFTFDRNGINLKGTAIAQPMETGVTLTAAPTSLEPKPILPTQLKVSMADTYAGLATGQLLRSFSLEFGLTDKFGLAWPIGGNPITVEGEPKATAKLTLATDTVGMGLIADMRASKTKYFRIEAQGALIADTYFQKFLLEFAAKVVAPADPKNQDNLLVMPFGLQPIFDSVWGKAMNIEIITDMATL